MEPLARILVGLGALLLLSGAILWLLGSAFPGLGLGRLPGDIRIERPGFTLYLPLATCLLLSVVVSLLLFLLSRLR